MQLTKKQNKRSQEGFTLIEILVVIGIIAVLAAVVLIAINPARQFAQANNSQRSSNVNAILNAVGQHMADNQGQLPTDTAGAQSDLTSDFCNDIVPTYMPALPTDPKSDHAGKSIECAALSGGVTGYTIGTTTSATSSRIVVEAPNAELDQEIKVTR